VGGSGLAAEFAFFGNKPGHKTHWQSAKGRASNVPHLIAKSDIKSDSRSLAASLNINGKNSLEYSHRITIHSEYVLCLGHLGFEVGSNLKHMLNSRHSPQSIE
jgi:hypothetical protein